MLDLSTKAGQELLTKLLKSSKASLKAVEDHEKKNMDMVTGPHPLYIQMVIVALEMAVHIFGEKPTKLLEITRPREDPEITEYRLNTFEPITQSKSDKAFTILLKIFNTKLWSINYRDSEQGQELKVFLEKNFYLFGDFILYIQKVLMKNMLADANGVVFYRPANFFIEQNEKIIPIPVIFDSWQILHFIPGLFYVLLDSETEGTRNKPIHKVWIVDSERIQLWKERHKANDGTVWILEIDWVHDFGVVPIWNLGGQVDGRFQGFFYKSFFSPASPHWNKAIISESDLDGAFINHMHPIRVEVGEDCDFQWADQQCINGQIFDTVKNKNVTCSVCKGSGRKSVKSPYGVYIINRDKFGEEANFDPVSFATVPTEPTKLLMDRRNDQLREGLEALNMEIVNQIGENQSGIAKEIDRDALNTTLQTISDHVFTIHVFNFVWFTGIYLFKTSSGQDIESFTKSATDENGWFPAIIKPTQFDTLTIKELTKQLVEAKKGNLSSGYIQSNQLDLNNKQFSADPELRKRINAITKLNPIPEKTVDQIISMVENRLTTKENAAISLNIEFLVDTAINKDATFLTKTRDEKFTILESLVIEFKLVVPLSE